MVDNDTIFQSSKVHTLHEVALFSPTKSIINYQSPMNLAPTYQSINTKLGRK